MNQIWLAFLTGLTTGGVSCLAVQGGLLASSIAQDPEKQIIETRKWHKIAMFLVAKVLAYTLLGLGLGLLGSTLVLTPKMLGWMQILAGLFMLTTMASLLNIHPIFRYFVLRPPKWTYRLLKDESKSKELFAPALLGFLTVLIPCGVTQAMIALALATANPWYAAGIMFAFTLGTSPIFFAMGIATMEILKRKVFVYIASFVILVLGLVSINTGQILRGSVHTFQNYSKVIGMMFGYGSTSQGKLAELTPEGKQNVVIKATSRGYTSQIQRIKVGVPVKLTVSSQNVISCARSFTIPSLNISKILPENGNTVIEFTPTKLGNLPFTCSMGMYSGNFTVVN